MNRRTTASRAPVAHPALANLQDLEREAHRLRAEYTRDSMVNLAITFDLQVRRLAHRIAARLWAVDGASTSATR